MLTPQVKEQDSEQAHQQNEFVNDSDSLTSTSAVNKKEPSVPESLKERITSIIKSLSFDELDALLKKHNVESSNFYKAVQSLKKEHITELEGILLVKINDSRKKSVTTELIQRYKSEIIDLTNRYNFSAEKLAESLTEYERSKKIKKPLKITSSVIRAAYQRLNIESKRSKNTDK